MTNASITIPAQTVTFEGGLEYLLPPAQIGGLEAGKAYAVFFNADTGFYTAIHFDAPGQPTSIFMIGTKVAA